MADMMEVVLITEYRDRDDEKRTRFTKLGAAFPYREGNGYVLKLQALPVPTMDDETGEIGYVIHLREPYDEDRDRGSRRGGGGRSSGRDRGRSDRGRDRDRDDDRRSRSRSRDEDRRSRDTGDDLDDEIPF